MDGLVGETDVEGIPISVRVDGHRGYPKITTGSDQPDGDLSAIGYQNLSEHRGLNRLGGNSKEAPSGDFRNPWTFRIEADTDIGSWNIEMSP